MEKSKGRENRASDFIIQGTILAAAGIIVRLIGMLYRIPLANILGDEGNGYYSAAFNIYSILLIVSSYSLPTAVSKMVATTVARKEYRNSVRILKVALFYGTVVGGTCALALWFGADFFAMDILGMPYTRYALKSLSPTILIIAYLGVFRGYFQGLGTMIPTAVSQIIEQIANAVISLVAAAKLFEMGIKSNVLHEETGYSFAFGAAGGTVGTGIGALAGLIFLLFLIRSYGPVLKRQARRDRTRRLETYGEISGLLVMTALPIVLSSVAYNISSTIDSGVFGNGMAYLGLTSSEVAVHWGIYSGKYHLLFNIPVAIANSLAASLIPSLSRAVASRNRGQIVRKVATVIRFSMIIAIPAAVGLTVLSGPVCNMLFRNSDNSALIQMMMYGSPAVVLFSLSTVTNAVLQGINHMQTPLINAVISLVLHVIILLGMLFGLRMGIYSVVYSNMLFALLMCLLNARAIGRYLNYRQEVKKTFFLPVIASGIMGVSAYAVYTLLHLVVKSNDWSTIAAVLAAVFFYGTILLKLGCVDEAELLSVPGGQRILFWARKCHLM